MEEGVRDFVEHFFVRPPAERAENKTAARRRTPNIALVVALSCWASPADAAYQRTGAAKATVCKGFVIQVCSQDVPVDAVSYDGRQFFEVTEKFDQVEEYNQSIGLCHVTPRRGWWHWVLGFVINTTKFYRKADTGYERIYPDYISFKCVPDAR